MIIKTFANAPKFEELQRLAVIVQTGTQKEITSALQAFKVSPLFVGKAWQTMADKLISLAADNSPVFTIIAKNGNSKIGHMAAFSTLPGVTCPGAGDCISFCYSYTSWRYPAAYGRQLQNTFLMRFNKPAILRDYLTIADNATFRLYVDGDFSSASDLEFWQDVLQTRPDVKAYGYSKSFALFLSHAASGKRFASNYLVNLSGGHNSTPDTANAFASLPVVRGSFEAVSIGRKVKSSEHGLKATNSALRNAYQKKAFTCPGKCGECTPKGHACGLPSFKGINIIIAVH
jgi:hypothetical protein